MEVNILWACTVIHSQLNQWVTFAEGTDQKLVTSDVK
jgi:hypothetical protein